MSADEKPLFPNLESTTELWNAAIEAAANRAAERLTGPVGEQTAEAIRKLKRRRP